MSSFPQWPKPSPVPVNSLVLLAVNGLVVGAMYAEQRVSLWWLIPMVVAQVFFFWAEFDIYRREKRNYDGWNEEMDTLFNRPKAKSRWSAGLASVKRQRSAWHNSAPSADHVALGLTGPVTQ